MNAAAPGRGRGAEATLRTVLGSSGADIRDEACVRIPVDRGTVGADGTITDDAVRAELGRIPALLADVG